MSNEVNPFGVVSGGLGKGCLAGLGLVVAFFAISGLVYVLLGLFGLASNIRLLVAVASGPTVGTTLVLIGFYVYSMRNQQIGS